MKNCTLYISLFLLTSVTTWAQMPELNLLNISPENLSTGIDRARTYYHNGNYIKAEALLYNELEKDNFKPNDFLLFANTLNVDNKPSLAQEFYKEYIRSSRDINAKLMIKDIFSSNNTDLIAEPVKNTYTITNPTHYKTSIFCAENGTIKSYDVDCSGSMYNKQPMFSEYLHMNMGSASYFDNGTKAIVSVIDEQKKTSKLYYFYQKNGEWKKPKLLFANTKSIDAFPYVNEQNKTLYFSSNRVGGSGGYDIYASKFSGKIFDQPVNMGTEINTFANDINPTIIGDWLYFSSNGHISKGGYDIYKFKKVQGHSSLVSNATGLNSNKNELSIVAIGQNQFLVNRSNKLMKVTKPKIASVILGHITDNKGTVLNNAYVLLKNSNGSGNYSTTDANGKFVITSSAAVNSKLISGQVMAEGYNTSTFSAKNGEDITVKLTKTKPIEVEKIVYQQAPVPSGTTNVNPSGNYANAVPLNPYQSNSAVVVPSTTDDNLSSSSRPDRGLYYIIIGSSYDFAVAYDLFKEWVPTFNGIEILEYGNGLYRIGYYAGKNEAQALRTYEESRKKKKDTWILRPKS